jgi:glycosyltransferase involved in cell wall biosynthesis
MRLVHVVPHISEEASGPSYSVPRLCASLAALGHEVELSCLAAQGPIPGVRLDVHRQWPVLSRFAVSPSHTLALRRKAEQVDIVHNHSLWSMVNVAAGLVVPGRRAKLVTSPRGTLSAWALSRSRHAKRALWPIQRRVLKRADLIHATSEIEYGEIRASGFKAAVAIIPNGIDLPDLPVSRPTTSPRTLLFLSRIHPIKGGDRLLHAWQQLQHVHPDWRLRVVGRGEPSHEQALRKLAHSLQLERVDFSGPLYGAEKSKAYFEADVFVLPTHSENFGMVVAEALAHGCPVVVSKEAPWAGVQEERCGWWVEHDVNTLTGGLDAALSESSQALREKGAKGRTWMERDFSWLSVAERMAATYRLIHHGGEPPLCVRTY